MSKNSQKYLIKNNINNIYNQNPIQENTFNKLGNLIISQSSNVINKKYTYNFDRNNAKYKFNNNFYNINEINNEKKIISASKENSELEKYDLFDKEEYNNLYKKGKGVTSQVKRQIYLNKMNNVNKFNIKDFDEKINSELSTIHNVNNENFNFMKTLDEQESSENNKNDDKMNREFS